MNFLEKFVGNSNASPCRFEKGRIQLRINNSYFTVPEDISPSTYLIDFIRNYVLHKGTKYMCREAGCGACIVAVKRFNSSTKKYEIFAINSCIVPLFLCSTWSIVTVEGIGNMRHGLNTIQSTLVKFSGSQCGYCTPGMVMNMFSIMNGEGDKTMEKIEDSFGGNICRCTGYRPILDAFKSLANDAPNDLKQSCIDIEDLMQNTRICRRTKEICSNTCVDDEPELLDSNRSYSIEIQNMPKWIHVKLVSEIFDFFKTVDDKVRYMLVGGHTSHGVYRVRDIDVYIDINGVDELHKYTIDNNILTIGANISLNTLMKIFEKTASNRPQQFSYLHRLVEHINLVANIPVRNIGTLAGNLSIKHEHPEFPSDLFTLLETTRASLTIGHVSGIVDGYSPSSFLHLNMRKRLILNVKFPAYDDECHVFRSYKIMQRAQNTQAYVNAGYLLKLNKTSYDLLRRPSIVYGGISPKFIHAEKTEEYLSGKILLNKSVIQEACRILFNELQPSSNLIPASPEYRRLLAVNLLYKCILDVLSPDVAAKFKSGGSLIERPLSSGKQDYQLNKSFWPVGKPIPKLEAPLQCTGEAEYVNDIPILPNELYVAVVVSKTGPAELKGFDISGIEDKPGFVNFLTAKDIPGKNTFVEGNQREEEELFVSSDIQYAGQVVGAVVATNQNIANTLAEKVIIKISNARKPLMDVKAIVESGDTSRIIQQGQKKATEKKKDIKFRIKGSFMVGGQYHFSMETQTCFCVPSEDGMDIYASTQWVTLVQQNVCVILKIPMNNINVFVRRLGGSYGAKLGRSVLPVGICALAAYIQGRPVRMVMQLESNMKWLGKRNPMYTKYDVAVNGVGEIQILDVLAYTDTGAHINDSITERVVTYGTALYKSDTWSLTAYDVKTDLPPNTFVRAPIGCRTIALIEEIMEHIAHVSKLDPLTVRLNNLSTTNAPIITPMLNYLSHQSNMDVRRKYVETFNKENRWKKRGLSVTFMNYLYKITFKYHVIISIYASDGTVAVTHGGVEVGQGINTKVAQAIAYKFGIDVKFIKIKPTNTFTAPNDDLTGDSNASDAVTKATLDCCDILLKRLEPIKKSSPNLTWPELILAANTAGIDLLAENLYSPVTTPITYSIYGMCMTEVEIDLLTGQLQICRVDLIEDVGQSLSPLLDIGQVEGAFVMGLGYWLHEKLVYNQDTGELLTNRTWTYTPPTAKDIPVDFRVYFRRNAPNPAGVLRSKAVGEPPLCLSVSAVFAIRNALVSARDDACDQREWFEINVPYTPENILMSSLTSYKQFEV